MKHRIIVVAVIALVASVFCLFDGLRAQQGDITVPPPSAVHFSQLDGINTNGIVNGNSLIYTNGTLFPGAGGGGGGSTQVGTNEVAHGDSTDGTLTSSSNFVINATGDFTMNPNSRDSDFSIITSAGRTNLVCDAGDQFTVSRMNVLLETLNLSTANGNELLGTAYLNDDNDGWTVLLDPVQEGNTILLANTEFAQVITIDPNASDQIIVGGTKLAAGNKITTSGAADDMVALLGLEDSPGRWLVIGSRNTISDAGP